MIIFKFVLDRFGYCTEGNFGGGKHWQIWQTIKILPNFSHPIFIYATTSACLHVVITMLIFKYFKHVATGTELDEHEDKGLLEPTGP